jgi:CHAD domain-containing protein
VTEVAPVSLQFLEGESTAEGARRIVRGHLGKAVHRLEADASGAGFDEAIHEARKRIKKARAVLRLARGPIGKGRADSVDRRLGDASRPLSESRDASVLLATFDALAGADPDSPLPMATDEARRFLVDRRDQLNRSVQADRGAVAEAVSALQSVRRRVGRWDLRDDDSDPARGLKRSYKRGRAALDEVVDAPSPQSFHELRKRVKDLGYQFQALGAVEREQVSTLDDLGQLLGELHDLDVLCATLEGHALASILPRVEERRAELQRLALGKARPIFLVKPRAFAREFVGKSTTPGAGSVD